MPRKVKNIQAIHIYCSPTEKYLEVFIVLQDLSKEPKSYLVFPPDQAKVEDWLEETKLAKVYYPRAKGVWIYPKVQEPKRSHVKDLRKLLELLKDIEPNQG